MSKAVNVQRGPDCSYVGLSYKPLVKLGVAMWLGDNREFTTCVASSPSLASKIIGGLKVK